MDKYQIHKFSQKLLQKSVFPHLIEYVNWRAKKKNLESDKFAPISINLDLTTGCNFQCDHCIDKEILNTGKNLDFEYVKTLLQDWSEKGLKSVILIGGGEPTLYPHFEEAVKFLKDLSLQIGLATNGTRMDRVENIYHLLNKKDWVRFSLDAGSNEVFEKIHHPRIKITLDQIMAGVREVRQKNSNCKLGYSYLIIGDDKKVDNIPLVNNIKEISLAAKLAKENGFNYLSVKPFINPEGSRQTEISDKNLAEIKEKIKKARELEDENFKVVESINLLCFYDEDLKKMMQRQPKTCHAQFFRSVVIPVGIGNCSLWRGFANTKIIDTNQKITKEYYQKFHQNRMKLINDFNAKETCGQVSCLYALVNWWIEELINSPEELEKLKPIDDFNDYFF